MFRKNKKISGTGFTLIEGIIAIGIISTGLIVGLTLAYSNLSAAKENANRTIATHLSREALEVIRNVRDSNYLRRDANLDKDCVLLQNQASCLNNGVNLYNWDDMNDAWPFYYSDPSGSTTGANSACPGGDCGNYMDVYDNQALGFTYTQYPYSLGSVKTWGPSAHLELFACMADPNDFTCHIQKAGYKYVQAWDPPSSSGFQYTQFYRRVLLKPICWDGTNEKVEFTAATPEMLCSTGSKVGVLAISQVAWKRGSRISQVQLEERLYHWR